MPNTLDTGTPEIAAGALYNGATTLEQARAKCTATN
eukprot:CAMPEP_0171260246 /NCGR_PEP_ID=MMETSP0790-20130122/55355_1 /TAXON_ID=2925 /ORGANISM="Alexandrium catenella, Strain OF101" /LENGTH=35 /DNA_ID= /DNA_START= /DNA_END= /DNA_ORIENTATION=